MFLTSRRHRAATSSTGSRRAGFTLVELMVSVMILTVGLIGLAATSGFVAKQMGGGSYQTVASTLAQSRFDSLSSLGCSLVAASGATVTGTATTRLVTEKWVIVDGNNNKFVIDSITVPERRTPLEYKSYIYCRNG